MTFLQLRRRARAEIRNLLGLYHLSAGLTGCWTTFDYAPKLIDRLSPSVRLEATVLFTCIALVFAAVAFTGVLLLRSHRLAKPLALVIQAAQVPLWGWGSLMYTFLAGAYAGVVWIPEPQLLVGWKATLRISWAEHQMHHFIGVNAAPILVLWLLSQMTRTTQGARGVLTAEPPGNELEVRR